LAHVSTDWWLLGTPLVCCFNLYSESADTIW
jgi:hypothetical protein